MILSSSVVDPSCMFLRDDLIKMRHYTEINIKGNQSNTLLLFLSNKRSIWCDEMST